MMQVSLDNIYREIMLLSDADRQRLYRLMEEDLYLGKKIAAYTTTGQALTLNEYVEQINVGLRQIENGETITDDELRKEVETW